MTEGVIAGNEAGEGSVEALQAQMAVDRLRLEQNLVLGIVGGAIGALIGAVTWAVITNLTGYQIGWMAVGVGFLAGMGIRLLGNGVDKSFGIAGAVLAVAGCALGNLLAVIGILSSEANIPFFELLSRLDAGIVKELMVATFEPMDVLFYGIAVYQGYKISFRRLTPQDLGQPIPAEV